jgi:hypothetical protein
MHIVTINASPKQLSKLRNGHSVRIKKGTGFNLIVHPENYHLVSRAFSKNKGIQVKLSPEEIEANKGVSPEQHEGLREAQPEMAGEGIFGKKFDRLLHKREAQPEMSGEGIFGKKFDRFLKKAGIKKAVYKIGDVLKPLAKKGLDMGIKAGATALSEYAPELAPALSESGDKLSALGSDYMDHPGKYQGKGFKKGIKTGIRTGGIRYDDYMDRAGLGQALSSGMSSRLSSDAIAARRSLIPQEGIMGQGLGGGLGGRLGREHGSIGRNAGMVHYMPPALVSQPLSANFQMSHFLPVQYQKYNEGPGVMVGYGLYGGGLGTGLYSY